MALASKLKSNSKFPKFLIAGIFLIIVAVTAYTLLQSGPWIVPESAKQLKNPLAPSESTLAATRSVYRDKCAECHGDSGKGDGSQAAKYRTKPSDLTDPSRLDAQTDGELFYKITYGHKPMPAFRKRLTDNQRWQLVLLIRDFCRSASRVPALSAK